MKFTASIFLDNTPRQTSSGKSLKKIVTPYVNTPHKFWRKSRELLIDELFKCYNETVFNNKVCFTENVGKPADKVFVI
jgi:hypothetical protein